MPPLRSKRPALALLALTTFAHGAAPLVTALTMLTLAPAPAFAQPPEPPPPPVDAYKQHMANGIRLYQDGNYLAAVTEFQAAYDARPKVNPLLNIALCYKAKFYYPKAIKTLEDALEKYGDTMDPSDKEASQNAVKEMRALLAYVTVHVTPTQAQATLIIDDEEQPAGSADQPIPMGPGPHRIAARAEGFAQAEQSISVASGDKSDVKLTLVADKGWVTVKAADPKMTIAIDQRVMGTGQWAGMLPPGTHLVQMYGPGGAPFNAQILVVAGKQLNVRPGMGGMPVPVIPVPPQPRGKKEPTELPPRRGLYALALVSFIFPTVPPASFTPESSSTPFGPEYGLRVGYQVNSIAGFDLTYQHSSISTSTVFDANGEQSTYRLISNRFAVGLRVISSGKVARFAGAIGGGFVLDDLSATLAMLAWDACRATNNKSCPLNTGPSSSVSGIDAFAYGEIGLEIDLDHVLINAALEGQIQSANNLERGKIYGGGTPAYLGPALRIGYRFW